jgi:UPF0755 protein
VSASAETTAETSGNGDPEQPGRRRGPRRAILIVALGGIAVVALVLLARVLAGAVSGVAEPTVPPGQAVEITILPGSSARTIAGEMEEAHVVSARKLEDAVRDQGVADQLKAGTYALETGMAPGDVVAQLVRGPNTQAAQSTVTILEGLTINEVLESLAAQTGRPVAEFEAVLRSGAVTSPFLLDAGADPQTDLAAWEGLLYPATYEFSPDAEAAVILTTMAAELVRRVEEVDWSRLGDLEVSRYEALIVASLIEREAKLDADRPLIASVIYNRLRDGMPLQIDATVIYAMGENPGRVLATDLEIDSPYNTYRINGLPPTPIGTVRQASLEAAADPAETEYRFYVVVSADGAHGFSVTYEEHQQKVQQAKTEGIIP